MTNLADLNGTRWSGAAELWTDPLGDETQRSDCRLNIDDSSVGYTWSYEGTQHRGSISLSEDGALFTDSWHQPEPMECASVSNGLGIFHVLGVYGPNLDWGLANRAEHAYSHWATRAADDEHRPVG